MSGKQRRPRSVANSVSPDQMPHSVASDLGLHCLHRHDCPEAYGKSVQTQLQIRGGNQIHIFLISPQKHVLQSTIFVVETSS